MGQAKHKTCSIKQHHLSVLFTTYTVTVIRCMIPNHYPPVFIDWR